MLLNGGQTFKERQLQKIQKGSKPEYGNLGPENFVHHPFKISGSASGTNIADHSSFQVLNWWIPILQAWAKLPMQDNDIIQDGLEYTTVTVLSADYVRLRICVEIKNVGWTKLKSE